MNKGIMLLTCAGESKRFKGWGPKWRLTHPSGNIMAAEAARSFYEHWTPHVLVPGTGAMNVKIYEEFSKAGMPDTKVVTIGRPTAHRMDTVRLALETIGPDSDAPILVRDCDNLVEADIKPGDNAVSVCDAFKYGPIDPNELSFVDSLPLSTCICRIAEDGLISRWFCSGAYAFARVRDLDNTSTEVKTMAEAMQDLVETTYDCKIRPVRTTRYSDWGTGEKWREFKRSYRTIFLDIDGVLLSSSHRTFGDTWRDSKPHWLNCVKIRALHETGRIHIVLCTSRPEVVRDWTITQLKQNRIPYDRLIMGLPACGRLLVNDVVEDRFDHTAEAVEVERDFDGSLSRALKEVGL